MAKGPGGEFEAEIQRSFPKAARSGRAVDVYKLPDPATRRFNCRCGGSMVTRCARCRRPDQNPARFSPKNPYDFRVTAVARLHASNDSDICLVDDPRGQARPVIEFAVECKRTQATIAKSSSMLHSRLPFKAVKDHQVAGLTKARVSGAAAGILWLAELPDRSAARCFWIPIESFVGYRDRCEGLQKRVASIALADFDAPPLDFMAPTVEAVEVEQDFGRGTSNRYWKLRELMIFHGADIEPTPERKPAKPRSKKTKSPSPADGPQTRLGRLLTSALEREKGKGAA